MTVKPTSIFLGANGAKTKGIKFNRKLICAQLVILLSLGRRNLLLREQIVQAGNVPFLQLRSHPFRFTRKHWVAVKQ